MTDILLCSPSFIRLNSNISDNVNSKVLQTAIREVQDDELQEILGQPLLEKIKSLVEDNSITQDENKPYKDALDKAQMYITYRVIAEIIVMLNMKIDNAGLIQTRDENMDYMDLDDTMAMKNYYDTKAAHYAYLLQNYLIGHSNELPELTECQCHKINATLYSAATPSVFLGGARGRGLWRNWPYRHQWGMEWPNRR